MTHLSWCVKIQSDSIFRQKTGLNYYSYFWKLVFLQQNSETRRQRMHPGLGPEALLAGASFRMQVTLLSVLKGRCTALWRLPIDNSHYRHFGGCLLPAKKLRVVIVAAKIDSGSSHLVLVSHAWEVNRPYFFIATSQTALSYVQQTALLWFFLISMPQHNDN